MFQLAHGRFTPLDCLADGDYEGGTVEGFGKKLNGTRLHCSDRHGYVAVAGNDDDGHVSTL
jgi:hypothetical protein